MSPPYREKVKMTNNKIYTKSIWSLDEARLQHNVSIGVAESLADVLPLGVDVVDYGCGLGFYVKYFRALGFNVIGLEGTPGINDIAFVNDIVEQDLCESIRVKLPPSTTLCLEVAEHIEPDLEDVFLDNITRNCNGRLILSWAIPGQKGFGHINEQPNSYVISELYKRGFACNFGKTSLIREKVKNDKCWWFKDSILIFDKI